MIYAARYDAMNALLAYLTENCCQGAAADCAVTRCEPAIAKKRSKHIKKAFRFPMLTATLQWPTIIR